MVSMTSILLEMDEGVEVERLSLDVGDIVRDLLHVIWERLALEVIVVNSKSLLWTRDLRRIRKLWFHTA